MPSKVMAFSAEQSSPIAFVTESCCICDEEFSSDSELCAHLVEHANDEEFAHCLSEDSSHKNSLPSTPTRTFPEFTTTTFVKDGDFVRNLAKRPASPEVWEIVSDDSDGESAKTPNQSNQKRSSSFRLVLTPSKPIPTSPVTSAPTPPVTSTPTPPVTSTPTPPVTAAPTPIIVKIDNGPPYKCRHCSLVCADVKSFKEHLQTHEKARPYSCDICNKTFAYKGTLRQHLHLHIGEKLHACKICHKKFTLKSVLRKHEETHDIQQGQAKTNGPQPQQ